MEIRDHFDRELNSYGLRGCGNYVKLKRQKTNNSESEKALMCNNRRYTYFTLFLHSKQLKNKTKSITLL